MAEFEVFLQGGSPWGFRLQGGREFRLPLRIAKVEFGGKADIAGIKVGDRVTEINDITTENLYHTEALTAVKRARSSLSLLLLRNEEEEIPPSEEKSRSIPSSPTPPRSNNTNSAFVPGGQGYMKKLLSTADSADFDDLPPFERERSKTLPKKATIYNNTDTDNTKSLPRKSTSGIPNKAPDWYKQMHKDIHKSLEGESHLSKLLTSDAQRGAFRKYDGAVTMNSPNSERKSEVEEKNSSDVPRRLQGGGRSIANHPNRKSLPNIHAANFNFMNPNNVRASSEYKASNIKKTEHRKSVNSDFYRQIQRGGDIPETGLVAATGKKSWQESVPQKKETKIDYSQTHTFVQQEINRSKFLPKQPSINTEYNKQADFLELRKIELKNREIEEEREALREKRERERIIEEDRLKKQRETDRLRIAAEEEKLREAEQEKTKLEEREKRRLAEEKRIQEMEKDILKSQMEVHKLLTDDVKFGKAKYSFRPQVSGELEFKKGETIRILKAIDQNWFEGEHNGEIGIFPCNYVEILEYDVENKKAEPNKTTNVDCIVKEQKASPVISKQKKAPVEEAELSCEYVDTVQSAPDLNFDEKFFDEENKDNNDAVDGKNYDDEINETGLARAKYSFKAETGSELSFKKGDQIIILRKIDDNWYEGELNGNVGIFPAPYVVVINEPKTLRQKDPLSTAVQSIELVKQTGMQEQAYNDEEQQIDSTINGITDMTSYDDEDVNDIMRSGEVYKAVYNYNATNNDEVELKIGDHVFVLEKCDDGWFVGTSKRSGAFGTFPGNYVVPLS